MKQSEFSKRFERFLRSLKFEDRVFLIFDTDSDGVSSAAIASFAFNKLGIKFSKTIPDFFVDKKFVSLSDFDAGVIVDVPTPTQESFLKKTKKKILVIDHHPSRDVQSKNVFYINPRIIKKEIYQPTSYTAYKLFSNFVDIEKVKWIAIMGTAGDYAFEDVKDLFKNEIKVKRKEEIWTTNYGKAATRLNATIAVRGAQKSFDILKNCRSLSDFFKNKQIESAHKKFSEEFWMQDRNLKKKMEFYNSANLIFAKLEPKYSGIASALASKTSTLNPNFLVVLATKIGNEYKIHGRMQSGRIDVGTIMKRFGGGGHRQAAGCMVNAKDLPQFKRKLIEILRKNK